MNVIDKIVAEAKREDEVRKKLKNAKKLEGKKGVYGEEVIENMLISPEVSRHVVDVRDLPVSFEDFTSFDPHIISTRGDYRIKYLPRASHIRTGDKAFVIGQDLLHWRVTVSGPTHFHCLAQRIPELGWLERNTTLTRELFGIAKKHPGMGFIFSVDWVRYADKITKKAEELGMNIDNKPFVSYVCSKVDFENKYCKKQLGPKKSYHDYIKEIAEADACITSVQEEE